MAPKFKVALIQLHPKPLDPEDNFSRASAYIRSAAEAGASLAVLPEYHLTGWVPSDPAFLTHAAQWQTYMLKYQTLAASLKINIVPGTIVQAAPNKDNDNDNDNTVAPNGDEPQKSTTSDDDDQEDSQPKPNNPNSRKNHPPPPPPPSLTNVSTFISSTGAILDTYTKKNLWHPERDHLTTPPSPKDNKLHSIVETIPFGPVGILVCWDLAFPEAFRELVRGEGGAKIIIIPTFWMRGDCGPEGFKRNPDAEALFLRSTLVARAFENTCCVIFVNAGGEAEDGYLGLSQVAMPFIGAVEGSFGGCEEGMRIVEVDMEILEEAERNYKVRQDLARPDWHYGYSHEREK